MKRWGIVAAAAFIMIGFVSGTAGAAGVLRSAEMRGETGATQFAPGSPLYVSITPYGPEPFPNDLQNFAGFTPDGLKVTVNRTGSLSGHTGLLGATRQWTSHSFTVQFELDEAAPFSYVRGIGSSDDLTIRPTLQAEGQSPVPLVLWGNMTGVLPAGRYTFSGAAVAGGAEVDFFSYRAGFTGMTLTVAPEPAALSLVAALPLILRRRNRRLPPEGGRFGNTK